MILYICCIYGLHKRAPGGGCQYSSPGPRLPSQPQDVTALWPVPIHTVWWRSIRVWSNNLPRVVTQPRPTEDRTRDLLISSPTPYACAHAPPHRERKCADIVGTVLVPWAGRFQCQNINIFSNKKYGSNFIKQHSETVMVCLPKCWLQF